MATFLKYVNDFWSRATYPTTSAGLPQQPLQAPPVQQPEQQDPAASQSIQAPTEQQQPEQLQCVFCREPFGDQPVEALLCGHTFHSDCIQNYLQVTNKTKATSCPFKCHKSSVDVALNFDDPDEEEDQPPQQLPSLSTSDDISNAREARIAAAIISDD